MTLNKQRTVSVIKVWDYPSLLSEASVISQCHVVINIQQYVNCELPDVQAGFEKAEKPEIKLPTSAGSLKKQESSRKTSSISALLTMPKPLTVWITTNCGKFLKMWEYQTTWPASWEPVCRPGSNGLGTTDWFQIGKGVRQGCILSPCLFNFYAEYIMRNAGLDEVQAGIKIAGRNINNLW